MRQRDSWHRECSVKMRLLWDSDGEEGTRALELFLPEASKPTAAPSDNG